MKKSYCSRLVGLFGFPVEENPTIIMQQAAFDYLKLDWKYITILVRPEDLSDAFLGLRSMNFGGINLTIPHKINALTLVDRLTDTAKTIGSINTVSIENGILVGHNTDGLGLIKSLKDHDISVNNKHLVILGAGGAARAISVECLLEFASSITIINRTVDKGMELVAHLSSINRSNCKINFYPWTKCHRIPKCDILINSTSVGLYPDSNCPDICYDDINENMIVQDIIPNPAETLFLKKAAIKGAHTYDGLSMLVRQGALSFELWTGCSAPIDVMYNALKKEFQTT